MATTDRKIWFGGKPLPCTVERFPEIKKPARKFRQYNIPGRSGDLFFQDDVYENVLQRYDIYTGSDKSGSQQPWSELAAALYLDGYQTLSDSYDPQHFRKAVFNGPIDVDNSWNELGRASIEFNCRPERFRLDGTDGIHYTASADNSYYILKASEIYSAVANYFESNGYGGEVLYAFDIPSAAVGQFVSVSNVAGINSIPFAIMLTSGDPTISSGWEEAGAMSGGVNTDGYVNMSYYDGWSNGKTLVVPSDAFRGIPYVVYAHGSPLDRRMVGGPVELNNPYMPCHPNIVLECTTAHNWELCAAIIDQYGIYIMAGDTTTPYYFIDTETMTFTRAATLTGERTYTDNVRVDAGIQLKSGINQIFTSAAYEMDLTPNYWEL